VSRETIEEFFLIVFGSLVNERAVDRDLARERFAAFFARGTNAIEQLVSSINRELQDQSLLN
jgi:hypothetical protein